MSTEPEAAAGRLRINGKLYEMPTDFTIGELRILERLTGTELNMVNWESAECFAAVALILLKRENPDYDEADLDDVQLTFVDDEVESDPPSIRPAVTGTHG